MNEKKPAEAPELRTEIWEVFTMTKNKELSHEVANAATAAARELLKSYALEQKVRAMQEPAGPALNAFFGIKDSV